MSNKESNPSHDLDEGFAKKLSKTILVGCKAAVFSLTGPQTPPFSRNGRPLRHNSCFTILAASGAVIVARPTLEAISSKNYGQALAVVLAGILGAGVYSLLSSGVFTLWSKLFRLELTYEAILGAFVILWLPWISLTSLLLSLPAGPWLFGFFATVLGAQNFGRGINKLLPKSELIGHISVWSFALVLSVAPLWFVATNAVSNTNNHAKGVDKNTASSPTGS